MATIVGGKGTYMLAAHDASFKLSRVEIGRPEPGAEDVAIALKYCGMCHSDLHTLNGEWGVNKYPIAAGHELAGIVTAVGANASGKFKVGDKVAVGCMVGSCMDCTSCAQGLEQHCTAWVQTYSSQFPEGLGHDECSGTWTNGGYSTGVTVHQRFCYTVPEGMKLEHAGPLCCAGVTTYAPLARWTMGKSDQTVGVVGLGGLGMMAVKLAKAMGCKVIVFSRSLSKKAEAEAMGATIVAYTDADAMAALFRTVDHVVNTVAQPHDINAIIATLKAHTGIMTMLGGVSTPYSVAAFPMIFSGTRIEGSLIGGCTVTQEMLDFCGKHNVVPDVNIIHAKDAETALKQMNDGDAGVVRNVIDLATIMDIAEYVEAV
ncbi:Zn-dependent alcohol dehydrogenase protein [Pelagophyceae sp. CCMP2097]|nr:Zn-dependent alcohol dehydrogenase protein [Pelagophyceae sp. CCMP2097]|eukprot:CAMPEP_0184092924 /NCGR_PEP_ID=MMETSP0974-20121125/8494_1 /TAXON_ID=483370 /ORGANISM="non described non described, Strain CCMP2097" /LENGTH=372 /DNA_ID=CAMNT_0026395689 /DNA_START=59 /DNA_END=1177 /DNA_ORIENTATION=+